MADPEAVNLVKEALASGKTEQEVIALMKQAGYTDQAISEVMAEIKRQPGDELARRIAEKNKIPLTQAAQKQPSAQPAMQSMPGTGLDKSVLNLLKMSFMAFIHPTETARKLRGNVTTVDGLKVVCLAGLIIGAVSLVLGLLGGSDISDLVVNFVGAVFGIILAWIIGSGILWVCGKIVGGKGSAGNLATGIAFIQASTAIIGYLLIIVSVVTITYIVVSSLLAMASASSVGSLFMLAASPEMFMRASGIMTAVGAVIFIFSLYILYLEVIFVREFMELSAGRAIIAVLLPVITLAILAFVTVVLLFGMIFAPASSYSTVNLSLCKSAAAQCSMGLATGTYASGNECIMCDSACSENGQEIVLNAVQYCKEGKSNLIKESGDESGWPMVTEGPALKIVDYKLTPTQLSLILGNKAGMSLKITSLNIDGNIAGTLQSIDEQVPAGANSPQLIVPISGLTSASIGSFTDFTVNVHYDVIGGNSGEIDVAEFYIRVSA